MYTKVTAIRPVDVNPIIKLAKISIWIELENNMINTIKAEISKHVLDINLRPVESAIGGSIKESAAHPKK